MPSIEQNIWNTPIDKIDIFMLLLPFLLLFAGKLTEWSEIRSVPPLSYLLSISWSPALSLTLLQDWSCPHQGQPWRPNCWSSVGDACSFLGPSYFDVVAHETEACQGSERMRVTVGTWSMVVSIWVYRGPSKQAMLKTETRPRIQAGTMLPALQGLKEACRKFHGQGLLDESGKPRHEDVLLFSSYRL